MWGDRGRGEGRTQGISRLMRGTCSWIALLLDIALNTLATMCDHVIPPHSHHPLQAPDSPTEIEIEFEKGNPVAIDGVRLSPASLLTKLNELGGANGIGRLDLVESRFVGMKSRGRCGPQLGRLLKVWAQALGEMGEGTGCRRKVAW